VTASEPPVAAKEPPVEPEPALVESQPCSKATEPASSRATHPRARSGLESRPLVCITSPCARRSCASKQIRTRRLDPRKSTSTFLLAHQGGTARPNRVEESEAVDLEKRETRFGASLPFSRAVHVRSWHCALRETGAVQNGRSGMMRHRTLTALVLLALGLLAMPPMGSGSWKARPRLCGVGGGTGNLLSWRLYGTNRAPCRLQRVQGDDEAQRHTDNHSTNYQDTAGGHQRLHLKAIIGGVEEATGTKAMLLPRATLKSRSTTHPAGMSSWLYRRSRRDGEYEYVVDRQAKTSLSTIDAYKPTVRSCGGSTWAQQHEHER